MGILSLHLIQFDFKIQVFSNWQLLFWIKINLLQVELISQVWSSQSAEPVMGVRGEIGSRSSGMPVVLTTIDEVSKEKLTSNALDHQ